MIGGSYQSSLTTPIDRPVFCDRQLLSELLDSLINLQMSCDRELLLELIDFRSITNLIDSPIGKKCLAIGSSYQSSLITRSTHKCLAVVALIRARWLPVRPTNVLRPIALIRALRHPDRLTNVLRSVALIRAHSPLIDRPFFRSEALIRAHWFLNLIIDSPTNRSCRLRDESPGALHALVWITLEEATPCLCGCPPTNLNWCDDICFL